MRNTHHIMKRTGLISALVALFITAAIAFPAASAAVNTQHEDFIPSTMQEATIRHVGSLETGSGAWNSFDNEWHYPLRVHGAANSRYSWEPNNLPHCEAINLQGVVINIDTPDNSMKVLTYPDHSDYFGAWPKPGASGIIHNIGTSLVQSTISAFSPQASFALTTSEVISNLRHCYDYFGVNNNNRRAETKWNFGGGSGESDATHYGRWDIIVPPNKGCHVSVEDYSLTAWSGSPDVSWGINIPSMPAPSKMSNAELEKYGIKKISISDAEANSKEIGISPQIIEEQIQKGVKEIYIAENIPVEIVSETG